MNEQRIQKVGDLLAVGKFQGPIKGDPVVRVNQCLRIPPLDLPDTLKMHRTDLDNVTSFLALQNAVSASSSHSSNVKKLSTIYEVVVWKIGLANRIMASSRSSTLKTFPLTFATSYANALGFDLEAQTAFVFPESCRYAGFHSWRRNLTSRIDGPLRIALTVAACCRAICVLRMASCPHWLLMSAIGRSLLHKNDTRLRRTGLERGNTNE